MTNQSLITPSQELVQQWFKRFESAESLAVLFCSIFQDGANQELEACLGEVSFLNSQALADRVRAARRPKPLSLKEQSIALLDLIQGNQKAWQLEDLDLIRRALEALPND